ENQNENRQHRSGGQGVAQQRQRSVTAGKLLRHDPGADHGGEQERGSQHLADNAPRQRRHQRGSVAFSVAPFMCPISLSLACSESASRLRIGSAVKMPMRWRSIRYVSLNAKAISASEPLASAGSGTPQCAVIGWPGHNGHASPAALSQTVNTKSSAGAPG